ncbi:hypothetical protein HK100_004149 [Physocladia obscura]|uniref:Glucosidase II subunit alpha n=1 Tax=Physocladia obscura TaxID=109957 RepID=A0AAD5TCD5_9FUNG|nr:hypothetical protein HK100_004149 [Physocladia obscura]
MRFAVLLYVLFGGTAAVKRSDFKTCAQSGFCGRQRAFGELATLEKSSNNESEDSSRYLLLTSTLKIDAVGGTVGAQILDSLSNARFQLDVTLLRSDIAETSSDAPTLRTRVFELNPLHASPFDVANADNLALVSPLPPAQNFSIVHQSPSLLSIRLANNIILTITAKPFSWSIARDNVDVVSFNNRHFFNYEYQRAKSQEKSDDPPVAVKQDDGDESGADPLVPPSKPKELSEREKLIEKLKKDVQKDMWEESFSGKQDSKPRGPTSIGFDIEFPGFSHIYGLPQHASSYFLKPTRGENAPYSEPYRLYNFDVFEYELDNPMALYGSVPFLLAHKKSNSVLGGESVGLLWVNAAEMWVDVEKTVQGTSTHWMAEAGILDLLIFLGPTPKDVSNQMTHLTGRSALPQHFSIGYHQSRWNYIDEQDVHDVDVKFDEFDIPYDVLWLDIEHTDGKRYFTWDKVKFAHPKVMQDELAVKGRKMVSIVDPHIKSDDGYLVSKKATELGLWVKNKDGNHFDGWCWPGTSHWIDYLNPEGRKFWAEQFKYSNYEGSTKNLYTWNDMNEPSVFNGPEITMQKDNLHFGGYEHREVHNIYGTLLHRSTAEGHLLRSDNTDRPFVLSRAFFIGTQRYGAIWTGDNTASWDHLAISIPMLLTIGVSGVTFCGADVGGFFGNPDNELLVRWYQIGSLQPFFRAHAHIDAKRREPWLAGEPYTGLMRESVRRRYRIMPYLYTLFWEANQNGVPVMRPLMYEFPGDEATYAAEDAFMVGDTLLVHPVVQPDVSTVQVYLPPSSNWYDYDTFAPVKSGHSTVATPLEKVPIFIRGGTIIPRRDRIRRAVNLSLRDPYTFIIALDTQQKAHGQIYTDDGHSYEYTRGAYIHARFAYSNGVLSATTVRGNGRDAGLGSRVERIVLVGLKSGGVKSVVVEGSGKRLEFKSEGGVVVVKDPKVIVGEEWKIVVS